MGIKLTDYFWKQHVHLLDFVDLVEDKELKAKLKTKILDVANEVRLEFEKQELEKNESENSEQ